MTSSLPNFWNISRGGYISVPLSDLNNFTFPLLAVKRLSAFINGDDGISSSTSICNDRVTRQVNKAVHLLVFAEDPLLFSVMTSHGPKMTTPTEVKGG